MYIKNELEEIVKNSKSKTEVLEKFNKKNNGGNYNVLTSYINKYEIDISHFNERGQNIVDSKIIIKRDLKDILVEKSDYMSSNHLKIRLYDEGLKERKCELCGQDENWNGKHMSLILDHINGSRYDNRIENLRIVCPNCNATLETHRRGNRYVKEKKDKKNKGKIYCDCGNLMKNGFKKCLKCHKALRKINRPKYEILKNEIEINGYEKTGRKYGVVGNTIKYWLKDYDKMINGCVAQLVRAPR